MENDLLIVRFFIGCKSRVDIEVVDEWRSLSYLDLIFIGYMFSYISMTASIEIACGFSLV